MLGYVEPIAVLRQQLAIVRFRGKRTGQPIDLGEVVASLSKSIVEYVGHRLLGGEGQLLVDEPQLGRPQYGAAVRLLHTGEQPQQGALPGSVLPDQTDPVSW